MKTTMILRVFAALTALVGAAAGRAEGAPLVIGWRDEMNDVRSWTPIPSPYGPASPSGNAGTMRLTLGHVPPGFPYTYQWGGVTRDVTVDLSRYPLLAVRTRRVSAEGYWDIGVHVLGEGDATLRTAQMAGTKEPEVAFFDVAKETGRTGRTRLQIRLHVGGSLAGAWAEYDWARFVRREDEARLRRNPDLTNVVERAAEMESGPLLVGWSDELNSSRAWQPLTPGGAAEVFRPSRGVMGLRLGRGATQDNLVTAPYPYQWGSVWCVAAVDLDRYPLLAVRTVRVTGDTWWDVTAQEWRDGAVTGAEIKTPSPDHPGTVLFDLARQTGWTGKKTIRLRLNVAGLKRGGTVEYAWIRFLRREDAERLRRNPDEQNLLLAP